MSENDNHDLYDICGANAIEVAAFHCSNCDNAIYTCESCGEYFDKNESVKCVEIKGEWRYTHHCIECDHTSLISG